ncbi:MAG: DUF2505 domain-containing protein [Moraxellaceae bacterium]|nr:DUF2505 domain-containing protein [Moraxellaceae bacterium]
MNFSLSQDYPVSLDVLWPVYGHPVYLEAKYRALGAQRIDVQDAFTDENEICVRLERTISPDLDRVPEWARRMVARDYVMRHENHCRRTSPQHSDVSLRITPLGSPVNISARGTFGEVRTGQTRLALVFEVQCSLPLVGRKVAEIFAGKIREALVEDHEFTLAYIGQR